VHCGVGKDRTGIVAGLLLAVAGVARDAILADYTLSGDRLRGLRPRRWFRTDPGHLAALLDRVDERHSGVAGYLRWAGLDERCQRRLGDRLRPPPAPA
jgi:protein-tyrosine phosphatase